LAACAVCSKVAASMPGTRPVVASVIERIRGPLSSARSCTVATVRTESAGVPAASSIAETCIE
jgi:hypothetical protein